MSAGACRKPSRTSFLADTSWFAKDRTMRVRELVSRCVNIIRNARYIPSVARMAYEVVEAQAEVAKHDYPAAEKRLKRLYSMGLPESVMQRSTASLLMALVSLKLGDPETAAELVPSRHRRVIDTSLCQSGRACLSSICRSLDPRRSDRSDGSTHDARRGCGIR